MDSQQLEHKECKATKPALEFPEVNSHSHVLTNVNVPCRLSDQFGLE